MDDFEVDEQDIAAQLGFAAFGGQSKSKKRKVDLVSIDVPESSTIAANANDSAAQKPPQLEPSTQKVMKPSHTSTESTSQAFRNGIRNEHGDMAYFKPSFIEDPWADLLKKRKD